MSRVDRWRRTAAAYRRRSRGTSHRSPVDALIAHPLQLGLAIFVLSYSLLISA